MLSSFFASTRSSLSKANWLKERFPMSMRAMLKSHGSSRYLTAQFGVGVLVPSKRSKSLFLSNLISVRDNNEVLANKDALHDIYIDTQRRKPSPSIEKLRYLSSHSTSTSSSPTNAWRTGVDCPCEIEPGYSIGGTSTLRSDLPCRGASCTNSGQAQPSDNRFLFPAIILGRLCYWAAFAIWRLYTMMNVSRCLWLSQCEHSPQRWRHCLVARWHSLELMWRNN